jgi:hypothetical protein
MTFDLQQILASKQAYRRRLANLPIGEKLRMLDALRERELAIRGRSLPAEPSSSILREDSPPYRSRSQSRPE